MITRRRIVFLGLLVFAMGTATVLSTEAVFSRIKREPVLSSNVASIGYSGHLHALEIEFTRGAIYRFLDVPRTIYRELMAADSKGHFIAEHIRGHFRFVRIRESKTRSGPAKSPGTPAIR